MCMRICTQHVCVIVCVCVHVDCGLCVYLCIHVHACAGPNGPVCMYKLTYSILLSLSLVSWDRQVLSLNQRLSDSARLALQ